MNLLRRIAVVVAVAALLSFAALAQITPPQGRLTLTSSAPVMTGDVVGSSTIYYAPYVGDSVPIYNTGEVSWSYYTFDSEPTLTLTTTAQLSGKVYDIFAVYDYGDSSVFIGTGPAWSSLTSRGSGIGTTQLEMIDGVWVNANAMYIASNGTSLEVDAPGGATYLGSVYMTANGETSVNIKPTPANGGTGNIIGIWNA
jgi:hypothetical protein